MTGNEYNAAMAWLISEAKTSVDAEMILTAIKEQSFFLQELEEYLSSAEDLIHKKLVQRMDS
jgi:uncharacterized protein YcgL (UPF0745 family)